MILRPVKGADAEARLARALTADALAKGASVSIERCRSQPWFSATFEGVQLRLTLTASPAAAARVWLAELGEAELPMRGHVAMPPAVDSAIPCGDVMTAELSVLVLIDG